MKIELRRITRPVRLGDYAEEYGEEVVQVWVNPSRAKRLELQAIGEASAQARDRLAELANGVDGEASDEQRQAVVDEVTAINEEFDALTDSLAAWYADIWSQHPNEETHWAAEDVSELVAACLENDPAFWSWLQGETMRLIREHRDGIKKK